MAELLGCVKVTQCLGGVVAGTTEQDGTGVDMEGFEGVLFIASVGALSSGAVTALKAQDAPDDSTWADIAGSAQSWTQSTGSNTAIILDIYKPITRYIRPVITRSTGNAVINGIIAIQYQSRKDAPTQDASVFSALALASPADGTA